MEKNNAHPLEKATEKLPHWLREAARILNLKAEQNGAFSTIAPKLTWYADKIEEATAKPTIHEQ